MSRLRIRPPLACAAAALVLTSCMERSLNDRSATAPEALTSARALAEAPPSDLCGGPFNTQVPSVSATVYSQLTGPQSDAAVACLLWQTFVYVNWPALNGSPGQPDTQAPFGQPGPVVWEGFKSYDQVFLPNGQKPAPWGQAVATKSLPQRFLAASSTGRLRVLHQTSKVSEEVLNDPSPTPLEETEQVGGGQLVDQSGSVVYYEMLLNQDAFNYVVTNGLYEAGAQNAFAQATGIRLPTGPNNGSGAIGTLELKSAWKVLTQAELSAKPLRFHTAQALLPGGTTPVTVGLVGLHIYQRATGSSPTSLDQGLWTTFAQVDNAPLANAPGTDPHSFYNPACTTCAVNTKTAPPTPTQVTQVFAVEPTVASVNSYMRQLISTQAPDSPWQFYVMLGVQWPTSAIPIGAPGAKAPLSNGSQSTGTLMNPVLETFLQTTNTSCLGCHINGHTSKDGGNAGNLAASYSFLLSHAKAAPKQGLSVPPAK